MRHFVNNWKAITKDPIVLNYIKGLKIPFDKVPFQKFEPSNPRFSKTELKHLKLSISKLLTSGAIKKCSDVSDQFISNIFLIPKRDGSFRFILNLKSLNKFISPEHFKMEDIRTATKLINKDCFMTTMDLQEAYFLVPIHNTCKKYLRFRFQGSTFEFQCLPFGLSIAPFIFTKLMKPVVSYLRNQGLLLVIYLDDLLCINNSFNSCLMSTATAVNFLEKLGFIINKEKSSLVPKQIQQFLGFEINSQNMCLMLPDRKRQNILDQTKRISRKNSITIRDFAKYLGLLCSACPAICYGWLYTKRFEREKFLALSNSEDNYDCVMNLSPNLKSEFSWWQNNILTLKNPIHSGRYTLEIFSDSSLTGWGIYCNGVRAHGLWSDTESKGQINLLELKAALIGLQCFAKDLYNKEILLRIDNTTAIAYINKYGGIQYTHLNDVAREIWQWCEQRKLFVFASYIKSKDNTEADQESRRFNIDIEWELASTVFDKITNTFGRPQIDLFATRLNAKCKKYISWKRDPSAYNIDAFTIDWSPYYFYAFPPFSLILKSLRKIVTDRATGIMVVPYWPSQPWYPLFLSLTQNELIYFEPSPSLLLSPFRTPHPLWKGLTLVSSVLSSNRT